MRGLPRVVRPTALLAVLGIACTPPARTSRASDAAQRIPGRLGDSTLWRLMQEYSEPWGTFRSENFVSNETSLQWVIPELSRRAPTGGVYMGVAPDQNFTYITALH